MQQRVSLSLTFGGFIIIIGGLLAFNGQTRIMVATLGVILACGGLLILLSQRVNTRQRPFIIIISILFIALIIGFIVKVLAN